MKLDNLSNNRYFGILFLIPILASFMAGGIFLEIIVALMAIRAHYEFNSAIRVKGLKPQKAIGYMGDILLFTLFFLGYASLKTIAVTILFITTATLVYSVFSKDHSIVDSAFTLMGFIYCCTYFSLIILISLMNQGYWYVFTIFTIAWGCDTSAYYGGKFFGKRKLIPEVSPKKTVEGAIIGAFGGAIITFLYALVLNFYGIKELIAPIHFLIMGLFGSLFSQVGDLIASVIKRDAGIKDYPKLIPGHGGILDRFDSVLMATVAVFLYLTIVGGY